MNVVDIVVILFFLFGGLIGFKRGFTRSLVSFLGLILILLFSYILKNPISSILYTYLPFFKFGGILKGAVILNILVYEWISFFLIFSILMIIFRLLTLTTKIFEKILSATIILGVPSKLLGMIVGFLESFVIIYIILFVLSLPMLHNEKVSKSKLREPIVNKTPILSSFGKNTRIVSEKFLDLKEKYKEEENASTFNLETLDLFLEYKIVSVKNIEKLVEKNKLKLNNIDTVLQKYK